MNHISLFTGIGGIDLASEWAGFNTILQVENDPYCLKVLEKHWPNVERCTDIRSLNGRKYRGTIDLVSGGFPCQPYSGAGKRKAFSDDRDLWPEMFRIVQEVRPTWVLGENVANFINLGLDRTLSNLESENYEVQCFNIPAVAIGAWHKRARVFIVAYSESNKEECTLRATESIDATGDSRLESTGCGDRLEKGRTGQAMADSASERLQGKFRSQSKGDGKRLANSSKAMADSDNSGNRPPEYEADRNRKKDDQGRQRQPQPKSSRSSEVMADSFGNRGSRRTSNRENASHVRQSPEDKGYYPGRMETWDTEPNVGRVAHGVRNRVHRLRALGNAVVPQQVFPILEAIAKIHKENYDL